MIMWLGLFWLHFPMAEFVEPFACIRKFLGSNPTETFLIKKMHNFYLNIFIY